jgi:hypothetical protein
MSKNLEIDISSIQKFADTLKKYPNIVKKYSDVAMQKSVLIIRRAAQEESPVDTGQLRKTIKHEVSSLESRVYPTVNYAVAVHEGVGARTILPKKKKFLAFKVGGKMVFAKKVSQKARKGNPFMTRAYDKTKSNVESFFSEAIDKTLSEIVKI